MSKYLIVALATAGSLLAGAAYAGDDPSKAQKPAAAAQPNKEAKPAKQATTPTAGASSTTVASSNMSSDVVAMAPIPDTKENRAKFGKPLSQMGRQTAARGN